MEQHEEQKQDINIVKRALLVEDYEACQRIMTIYLGELGYQVDLAADGITAIQNVHSKTYDLIIEDIGLSGGISGREVIQNVRDSKLNAGTVLIVWSAYVDKDDEEKYLNWGADGVLIKASQLKKVKKAIGKCLLTSRYKRKFHFQLKGLIDKWVGFLDEARGLKEDQFTRKLEFILCEAINILKEHRQWLDFQQKKE